MKRTHRERTTSKALDRAWAKVGACAHARRMTDAVVGLVCLDCGGLFEKDAEAEGGGNWVVDWRKVRR